MWRPYLKVIAKKAVNALNIFDRFHIMAHMNKAIDKVREGALAITQATRKSHSAQDFRLSDLVHYNLESVRSYPLKEEFQLFWLYKTLPICR